LGRIILRDMGTTVAIGVIKTVETGEEKK